MNSDTEEDYPTRRRRRPQQHLWQGVEEQEEKEEEEKNEEQEEEGEASEESTGRFSFPLSQKQMESLSTPKDQYLRVIHEQPDNGLAYVHLGTHLRRGGKIVLLNGKEMTKQEIYLKALDLLPGYSCAYINVGSTVDGDQEYITLLNGEQLSKQELFIRALDLDPNIAEGYYNLGYSMWNPTIKKKEVTLMDGTTLNQQQCFIRAIHIKPTYAAAYYELFSTIPTTAIPVVLENGDILSKQQLIERAVSLLPCAHYYSTLAGMLSPGQTVILSDGTSANAQRLYILAIELEPTEIRNYQLLTALIAPDQRVKLQDGREVDRRQLALVSLDLQPDGPLNYWNLASTFGGNWEETQTLLDGTVCNKEKLLLALLNLDPKDTPTLLLLGKRLAQLGPEATFTLMHGPVKSGQQFLLHYYEICLETGERLDPMVFHWLGLTVPKEGGAILLPDGAVANRARLFWEALRFQPNALSFLALADCLETDPSSFVELAERKYGKQDLLREAYLLDPTLAPPSSVPQVSSISSEEDW